MNKIFKLATLSITMGAALLVAGCASNDMTQQSGAAAAPQTSAVTEQSTEPAATTAVQTTTSTTSQTTTALTTTAATPAQTSQSVEVTEPTSTTVEPLPIPDTSIVISEQEEESIPSEQPILTENDVLLTLPNGSVYTSDDKKVKVEISYIGAADSAEYCFGCDYTLYKWSNETGDWAVVPFSDNAAFNALGYLIGTDCPTNSITVSLADDFYAEPLTAGTYLIVKPITADIELKTTFEYKDVEGGVVIEQESGKLELKINEIKDDMFVCSLVWPYPAEYRVICTTADYSSFSVGDTISVEFAPMYKLEEYVFSLTPVSITSSDFALRDDLDY